MRTRNEVSQAETASKSTRGCGRELAKHLQLCHTGRATSTRPLKRPPAFSYAGEFLPVGQGSKDGPCIPWNGRVEPPAGSLTGPQAESSRIPAARIGARAARGVDARPHVFGTWVTHRVRRPRRGECLVRRPVVRPLTEVLGGPRRIRLVAPPPSRQPRRALPVSQPVEVVAGRRRHRSGGLGVAEGRGRFGPLPARSSSRIEPRTGSR